MEEKKKKPLFKKILPAALFLVIIGGIVFGIKQVIFYRHYKNTDDAQIDGNISPAVARVGGYVEQIRFKDNQLVNKGDTLVILDDKDYRINLEQAEAALRAARSGVNVSTANVSTTRANVEPATANVTAAEAHLWEINKTYDRYKNLLEGGAITQAQFDAVKAQKESAEAQVTAAQKQVTALHEQVASSKEQVAATSSKIAVEEAAVDFARLQLSYTVITAPETGIVSKRTINIGQLVRPGEQLFAVVQDKSIYITANFKETQIGEMKAGQPVTVKVDTYPGQVFKAHVSSFSGASGARFSLLPPDNATGNYVKVVQRVPVRIDFDSLDAKWYGKLLPGMSVTPTVRIKD